ncbi:lipopolysaccharide biosynthesis protein [Methylopila sp. Yamaguchi]|uniref:lipopolysaccharide biosynthesis protein n=1 Tax=Methylopila sp. Yamaguchi TaxID=1437817 RepID=UPI000CA71BA4|nr:hypothetical protein [Methylopila sp. Yamaguchi]GBD48057.1 polysaccharide biosynthesis protein [Methylopila sp. Yamaguchi]
MSGTGPGRRATVVRRIALAVSAMWMSRLVAIALGLVLMPALFKNLPKAELGVWLLLSQSGVMLLMLDLGLTSTLTRRFAFRRGEATGGPEEPLTAAHAHAFAGLIATGRVLYRGIAASVGLLAWGGGLLFIATLPLDEALRREAEIAWTIICVSQSIALSNGLWTSVIAGLGHVAPIALLSTGMTSLTLLAQTAMVWAGGGLVALAAIGAVGNVVFRVAAIVYLRRNEPAVSADSGTWSRAEAETLLSPSLKYFLTEIGAILLTRTDQYFIAGYLNPESIPAYFASYTLAFNAALIAIAIGDAANIYVSQLWRTTARDRVAPLVLKSMRIGMGLMALATALLLFAGDAIIAAWLGVGHYAGLPLMATFCAMLLVYTQQSLLFGFSRATENEIYAAIYLAAGALNVALSFVLAPALGLVGVALATLLAQLATTGWQIPATALRRLDIPWRVYVAQVLAPVLGLFLAAAASMAAAAASTAHVGPLPRALACAGVGGLVALLGFWTLVLDHNLRAMALGRARRAFGRRLVTDA